MRKLAMDQLGVVNQTSFKNQEFTDVKSQSKENDPTQKLITAAGIEPEMMIGGHQAASKALPQQTNQPAVTPSGFIPMELSTSNPDLTMKGCNIGRGLSAAI